MRKAAAFALAIASVGSAVLLIYPDKTLRLDADGFPADWKVVAPAPQPAHEIAARPADAPRVFSPGQPLLATTSRKTDAAATAAPPAPLPRQIAGDMPPRKLASSRPADDEARRELVRDLQTELKRVGCYEGEVNGVWTPSSKKAMAAFTDRVNATLPLEEPDFILLTLVQGHGAKACGRSCPGGQALGDDGKCVPRAVLAHAAKNEPRLTEDPAPGQPAKARSAQTQTKASTTRVASAWSTVVTTTPPEPATAMPSAPRKAPVAPLPGRMAIGAVVEPPTADIESTRPDPARRRTEPMTAAQRGADIEAERKARLDEATVRKAQELASKQRSRPPVPLVNGNASTPTVKPPNAVVAVAAPTAAPDPARPEINAADEAAAPTDNAAIAAAARKASLQRNRVRAPARREPGPAQAGIGGPLVMAAPYRAPIPRPLPPYAMRRVANAPLPSYAPQPTRWTRTIFTDIDRSR